MSKELEDGIIRAIQGVEDAIYDLYHIFKPSNKEITILDTLESIDKSLALINDNLKTQNKILCLLIKAYIEANSNNANITTIKDLLNSIVLEILKSK